MNDNNKKMKVIPLGGVEEIGINSTIYEYQNDILVVDVGSGFPDADMYGVDFIIPNFDYLMKNKDRVRGILITHGHLDHIGALKYILPRLDFPKVYGTRFTVELIKTDMQESGMIDRFHSEAIDENSVLQLGEFTASFFRVNHSIPQCVGICIKTEAGTVVQTGDFKFDNSPVNEPIAEYAKIARMGEEGVDLLLSDSTNSLRKGYPISETDVARSLEAMIERAKGRVIVASFSGLVGRLYQVMQIAEKQKRKVAIAGYSMNQSLRIAQEIGYIKPTADLIIPFQKINRYHDDKLIILTTGAQGESNAALYRMASDEYKNMKLKKGDTVIISAGTIPGNNVAVQNLIEAISARGAIVQQSEGMDFFTSGHGYQEDQKIMLNLVKPKYFMPVHGYQYFLREHGHTAVSVGVKESNVIIAKRGSIVEGNTREGFRINGQIKAQPVLVSGTGVGDVGESVLAERQQLGNHGVIVIDIAINADKKALALEPYVVTRGFIFVRTNKDLLTEIRSVAEKTINHTLKRTSDVAELRRVLEENINGLVYKEIGRTPVVLPLITFANTEQHRPKQRPIQKPRKPLHHKPGNHSPAASPDLKPQDIAAKWNIPEDSLELLSAEKLPTA